MATFFGEEDKKDVVEKLLQQESECVYECVEQLPEVLMKKNILSDASHEQAQKVLNVHRRSEQTGVSL